MTNNFIERIIMHTLPSDVLVNKSKIRPARTPDTLNIGFKLSRTQTYKEGKFTVAADRSKNEGDVRSPKYPTIVTNITQKISTQEKKDVTKKDESFPSQPPHHLPERSEFPRRDGGKHNVTKNKELKRKIEQITRGKPENLTSIDSADKDENITSTDTPAKSKNLTSIDSTDKDENRVQELPEKKVINGEPVQTGKDKGKDFSTVPIDADHTQYRKPPDYSTENIIESTGPDGLSPNSARFADLYKKKTSDERSITINIDNIEIQPIFREGTKKQPSKRRLSLEEYLDKRSDRG
jgi:hypothetical protein